MRAEPGSQGRVHVLAIGGAHQFAHILPVARELEARRPGSVSVFVCSPAEADEARVQMQQGWSGPIPQVVVMRLPGGVVLPGRIDKTARLLVWARRLCRAGAILCAERTSTLLRRIVPGCPPIVHIPHGAGDRAVGFEKRFMVFDRVLVAGRKDRDRLVASGFVKPQACVVTGPVKLATILSTAPTRSALFANDRPTILYNPHFAQAHSSLAAFGQKLVEAVVRDGRWNLVVAPHVRLARGWSDAQRAVWEALAVPGQVMIDLGSPRSSDMTYTLGADLYVGDVSSQVYEFLVRPRPCLFVNAHGVDWQGSEDYAMWRFGEVIAPDADPVAAIVRAFAGHASYLSWQRDRMAYAIEGIAWDVDGMPCFPGLDPVARAADEVERFTLKPT
ncbi:hypothetical protein [Novosphingobium sp. Leaf2]|uniref:hypothetical protein n=1 Tax=Novosphingobium sp. Leaf2 TaxID=1735670 RepID=UPI0006FCACD5|nr:hypothetical protein [Novosphingobium sp. Leaf2]KQM21333.1 glycosyl transferase [Novosphingobium sp. Leaf2]